MITFRNASKRYNDIDAISDVSFKVSEGEIVGLLGLNGAGKTTTMRLVTGGIVPTSGYIRIDGKDPIANHAIVSNMIGYLPENNPLYLDMLVREYLDFVSGIKTTTLQEYIEDVIKETGLTSRLNQKIDTLSRGYRQRVGLAAALLGDPKILILDEPTSGLDPIEQEKIRDLIQKLGEKKTIVFSTHVLSEVEGVATRIIILREGRVVFDGKNTKARGSVETLFKKYVS